MPFQSILFEQPDEHTGIDAREEPPFFADLNLDQVMAAMTAGRDEYNLAPYFLAPLHTVSAVDYRQQILHDLEAEDVRAAVDGYARGLSKMRSYLALMGKLHDKYQRERCFLDAVNIYCQSTRSFAGQITGLELKSSGFAAFREHLGRYAQSGEFTRLATETHTLLDQLAEVRYADREQAGAQLLHTGPRRQWPPGPV